MMSVSLEKTLTEHVLCSLGYVPAVAMDSPSDKIFNRPKNMVFLTDLYPSLQQPDPVETYDANEGNSYLRKGF